MAAIAWATVIAVFSSDWFSSEHTGAILLPLLRAVLYGASEPTIHLAHAIVRKAAHAVEYAVLAVLLVRALRNDGATMLRAAVLALALASSWAVADEMHQAFVPSRTPAARDVLVDVGGAVLGVAASGLLATSRTRLPPRVVV